MSRKFYPTPSTTAYYINGYALEDMFRVDFKRTQKHQPVYGYSSKKFDFVAKGKELVTGQLIINYRYPGYLRNVIKTEAMFEEDIQDMMHNAGFAKTDRGERSHAIAIAKNIDELPSREEKVKYLSNFLLNREAKTRPGQIVDNVDFHPSTKVGPDGVFAMLKANYERRYFPNSSERNPLEGKDMLLSSPLDEDPKPFDITVRYGFKDAPGGYARILKDIYLIGEEQVVSAQAGAGNDQSSSAQPILEIYPFFCRTIETRKYKG